ncbi:response regulator [Anaerolineales bacterium HSG6]|nr:response regulator [Anaerolineales bacterium HSG6]
MSNDNPQLKILMVEDTPVQAERFKTILEECGYDVYWADTGESGLAIAEIENFDLAILDVELPGINGFEVCKQLKSNPKLQDMPILMLTTRDRADDVLQGLDLGAVDYIPKDTFAGVVLTETIKHMFEMGMFGAS